LTGKFTTLVIRLVLVDITLEGLKNDRLEHGEEQQPGNGDKLAVEMKFENSLESIN
jgi:hypothetical protein